MNPCLRALGLAIMGGIAASTFAADRREAPPWEYFVYFGTYTKGESKGIYRARLDSATGRLSAVELAAECGDPAFLAVHPSEGFLYAINERTDPVKNPGRGVRAYSVDGHTGALTFLNEQSAGGAGPCHLTVDPDGRCVLVANYSGGSVAALPLTGDGRLSPPAVVVQHTGSSVHPTRQKQPHAHGIYVAPGGRFALTPDLGLDRVLVYRLDAARAALTPNTPAFVTLDPGSGPRHLAFHPDGRFVYVINELLCTVTVFSYNRERGELKSLQTVSTLPAGEPVKSGYSTAEVMAHPNGRFLYGSNRGHHSIAGFAINLTNGHLTQIGITRLDGRTPRHFTLDPTGAWLLAEHQDSDTVQVFRVDSTTGGLVSNGQSVAVPAPVCAVFVRAER